MYVTETSDKQKRKETRTDLNTDVFSLLALKLMQKKWTLYFSWSKILFGVSSGSTCYNQYCLKHISCSSFYDGIKGT